jgi:hypothetical protein
VNAASHVLHVAVVGESHFHMPLIRFCRVPRFVNFPRGLSSRQRNKAVTSRMNERAAHGWKPARVVWMTAACCGECVLFQIEGVAREDALRSRRRHFGLVDWTKLKTASSFTDVASTPPSLPNSRTLAPTLHNSDLVPATADPLAQRITTLPSTCPILLLNCPPWYWSRANHGAPSDVSFCKDIFG